MSRIQSHRDLIVWQKSMNLAVAIYELTNHFPSQEQYRLTAQITRAAISVPANIAEGHARASTKEFPYFLSVSRGSLMEVETFVMLAARLGCVADQRCVAQQAYTIIIGSDQGSAVPCSLSSLPYE